MANNQQIQQDINAKLNLERALLIKLRSINADITKQTVQLYGNSGITLNADLFKDDFDDTLVKHYGDVGAVFDNQLRQDLPDDVPISDSESNEIATALALYFMSRAGDQSQIITDTNQKDINASIAESTQIGIDAGTTSRQEVAVVAGAILGRKLLSRAGTIAMFETESIAEVSRGTEAEVLSGSTPSIIATSARAIDVRKEWVTMGDEAVRHDHMLADSQSVKINDPFKVGGELLMYPKDASLGASAKNIINCRCFADYNQDDINAVRRS